MNPQIEALHRLQGSDRKMVALEARLVAIPRRLAELDADLAKLEAMLRAEREKLGESRDFRRSQEMQLSDEEEHIRMGKGRLGSATTTRELNAAQRELDTTRRLAQARAEEITKITAAIGDAEKRIAGMEAGLAELRAQADSERERLASERGQLEEQLGKTRESRNRLTEAVERALLRTYERVRSRSGGIAFVAARERRCTACKMTIPHSIYVSLRRGEEILHCEGCGRLLYWSGHFREPAPGEGESTPRPKPAPGVPS